MRIPIEKVCGSMLPMVEVDPRDHSKLFDVAVDCVSDVTGISRVKILGTERRDEVIFARFSAYKIVHDEVCAYNPPTYSWIASKFTGRGKKGVDGGKHHGSVMHGIESLCNRIRMNIKEFKLYSLILAEFEKRRASFVGVKLSNPYNIEKTSLRLAASRCAEAIKNNEAYLVDIMERLAELDREEKGGTDDSLVQDKLASNG